MGATRAGAAVWAEEGSPLPTSLPLLRPQASREPCHPVNPGPHLRVAKACVPAFLHGKSFSCACWARDWKEKPRVALPSDSPSLRPPAETGQSFCSESSLALCTTKPGCPCFHFPVIKTDNLMPHFLSALDACFLLVVVMVSVLY